MTAPAPSLSAAGLEVTDLSIRYGRRTVVHDLSFRAEPGTLLGVIGPNGSGKSTTIRALAGIQPHAGTIRFDGRSVADLRSTLGYMPQEIPGDVALTCLESVIVASRDGTAWRTSACDLAHAHGVLERLEIDELADRFLGECSGGQRQLVSLAQTLVRNPRLLLLDEPTSALDLRHQASVFSRVRDHVRSTDALAIAAVHDLNLAAQFCDELLLMDAGRIRAQGAPREVLRPEVLEEVYGVGVRIVEDGERVLVTTR